MIGPGIGSGNHRNDRLRKIESRKQKVEIWTSCGRICFCPGDSSKHCLASASGYMQTVCNKDSGCWEHNMRICGTDPFKCLILSAGSHIAGQGQMPQKRGHLRRPHAARMPPTCVRTRAIGLAVKSQIPANPLPVCLFRSVGIMVESHDLPNLVAQFGSGVRNQQRPGFLRCFSHFEYPARISSNWFWTAMKAKNKLEL